MPSLLAEPSRPRAIIFDGRRGAAAQGWLAGWLMCVEVVGDVVVWMSDLV